MGQSSTNVGQATKAVERILLITHTLDPQLTCARIWSRSVSRIWSLIEARCLGSPSLGLEASDNNQPLDQSEEHESTKEYKATDPTQKISSVMDNEIMPTIEQIKEDSENPVSSYISKIVDPSNGKPWTPQSRQKAVAAVRSLR